jgi:hypothetical protein
MKSFSPRTLLVLLIALGAISVLANRTLPLVRNSLVYASASQHVIEHDYDPRPVVADSKLSYDKPILYAWVSAPFVRWLGSHDGLRLTSFLGTVAYLLAALYFARSFRASLPDASEASVPGGSESMLLWLSALGPCVVYQFWSAHPDGWFAALIVLAWALAHRIVVEPDVHGIRRLVALGVVIYVSILLKNYGLILLIACPLYFTWNLRTLRAAREHFRGMLLTAIVIFALIGVLVLLAWTGHHPLSRLEGEGGGVGQYATGELARSLRGTWVQLGLALLIQFQIALVFAFRRAAWTRELIAPLVSLGGTYVAGLMPFPTTFYNMRYFVPLFPLAALVLVRGMSAFAPVMRRALFVAHAVAGIALIVVFNCEPAYRAAEPAIPLLEVNWIGVPLSLLDNLRMRLHVQQADVLANIDREVPAGATLYMMDVVYYGDAQQGVFERAGRIRSDIAIHYVSRRDLHPSEPTFFVWSFFPARPPLEPFGRVTDLGQSLYRVEKSG